MRTSVWHRAIGAVRRRGASLWANPGGGLTTDFRSASKPDAPRLLFVALFDPAGIRTIPEQVEHWCGLSRFRFDLLNLWGLRRGAGFRLPSTLSLPDYAGVVVHCTAAYEISTLTDFDKSLPGRGLAGFAGAKMIMKQDEHFRAHLTAEFLGSRAFHLVVTMARPSEYELFYPRSLAGPLAFLPGLTGFVTREMRELAVPPPERRSIDVGYRGSLQPWNFGRLAWEKRDIGDRFQSSASGTGLTTDISNRWEDRFVGTDWFRFLMRCRAVLGVESGASIIDFDGMVRQRTEDFLRTHEGASFEEVHAAVLQPFEGNGYYRTISPRHFEAAACGCAQVLYEGDYAGIFRADEHFIPLRRDFSNFGDVVRRLRDPELSRRMVTNALEGIVKNPEYGYERFVQRFDDATSHVLLTLEGMGGHGRPAVS